MLRVSFLLVIASLLLSCNRPSGIKDLVSSSDSVAINFFKGDGTMDTVVKVVILRDKKQLDSLAGYIESGGTDTKPCGNDGSLHFFRNNMVLKDIDFSMHDEACRHFAFSLQGKRYNTRLSVEARQFLVSLRMH